MKRLNVFDVEEKERPINRKTRMFVNPQGDISAENFIMGQVVIEPGGKVPMEQHANEEAYLIVEGTGKMTIGEETETVSDMESNQQHQIINDSDKELKFIFVAAPNTK